MGGLRYIFLFFICVLTHVYCFSQIKNNEIIDSINSYISEGLFVKASNRIVDIALYLESIGEKESALSYRIWNCKLIEDNIDYFGDHGLSLEGYFSNKEKVCILYRDLGQKTNAINMYLSIIKEMKATAPDLIPFFTNFICPILADCTEPGLCDSVYSLSYALDVIKEKESRRVEDDSKEGQILEDMRANMMLLNKQLLAQRQINYEILIKLEERASNELTKETDRKAEHKEFRRSLEQQYDELNDWIEKEWKSYKGR